MKRVKAVVLLLMTALTLSACDFDVYELPLPGGPDVGSDHLPLIVELGLAPGSGVEAPHSPAR